MTRFEQILKEAQLADICTEGEAECIKAAFQYAVEMTREPPEEFEVVLTRLTSEVEDS